MITHSIIQKSQLEGASRIDADYYQPEYLEIAQRLQAIHHKKLDDISESLISFGAYDLTNYIEWTDDGGPFIEANNIKEGFIDYDGAKHISEKSDEILKKSRVKEGQVLLAMSGSVGNAAIAEKIPSKLNSNQDIVKITLKRGYSPYFITAFLNCKYGRGQVLRLPVGSVQQHIFLWQTKTILIPTIPTITSEFIFEIENIYKQLLQEAQQSKSFLEQAENMLLQELGLADFRSPDDLTFEVRYSDVKKASRMDAEYFQPKYEVLVKRIKEHKAMKLGEIVSLKKGIEPGSEAYQDEGKLFIRVSSLSKNGIEKKDQKYVSEELYQQTKLAYEPKVGEILLTKDATPGIAYVVKEQIEGIISGGILRCKLKSEIDVEYLALCINSIVGQMQIEQSSGGSIIEHWKPEQARKLLVPILSTELQQQVGDLVKKSHEARMKSKELLEEAKRRVEDIIEKGGE